MLFNQAIELLKSGECLYRLGWTPQDGYIVFMKGMTHVWKVVLHPAPNAGNYIFSMEDFNAEDWEKFEVPQAPIEAV